MTGWSWRRWCAGLVVLASVVVFIIALPRGYQRLLEPCAADQTEVQGDQVTCTDHWQLTPDQIEQWEATGLSMTPYANIVGIGLSILTQLPFLLVALVLFTRRPDDPYALLVAMTFIAFGLFTTGPVSSLSEDFGMGAPMLYAFRTLEWFGIVGLIASLLVFPTGKFVPRWTGAPLAMVAIVEFFAIVVPKTGLADERWDWVLPLGVLCVVAIQIWRYFRASDPVQRQQTKLVVFGVALGLGLLLATMVLQEAIPAIERSVVGYLIIGIVVVAALALIPLSMGLAILRYRLWDIDRIVPRTVTYAVLTAVLIAVYVAGVVGLSVLFDSDSDLVVALSTLAVAALFNPVRRRVQSIVDRRFDRANYEATNVVDDFAIRLRSEMDLDGLSADLAGVVTTTLRPEMVSVWLRKGPS